MNRVHVVLSCGGTGGHIYPAIAVAQALHDVSITFLGSNDRLDHDTVTRYGFRFVSVGPSRGNLFKLIPAFLRTARYLIQLRPSAVICTGGKITIVTGLAAALLRIPVVVMEQNQIAGRTNRVLARFATWVVTAFPHTVGLPNGVALGNPVRNRFLTDLWLNEALAGVPASDSVLLVFGGSQGAWALNHAVESFWRNAPSGWSMIHILGPSLYRDAGLTGSFHVDHSASGSVRIRAPYVEEMDALYKRADVVVCRAGATSIAELLQFRIPAVLVPYPFAMDDHQTANANWMKAHAGASVVMESELSPDTLKQAVAAQANRTPEGGYNEDACLRVVRKIRTIWNPA